MSNIWVVLNETKDQIVAAFETESPDSKPHWEEFFKHRPGCVFCGRTERMAYLNRPAVEQVKWYFNYFYWEDMSRWGYGDPDGIGWSAAMALPEPIKMLAFVGGIGHGSDSSRH
jgi:hypothetical protein